LTEPALPEGRRVVTVQELLRSLSANAVTHVVGASGLAAPLVAHAAADGSRRVLYIAADTDSARRAAEDLRHLSRGLPVWSSSKRPAAHAPPQLLLCPEETRYADVHPDRRMAMERAAALAYLASARPYRWLIVSAPALVRRVPPPEVLARAACTLRHNETIELGVLARRLTLAGYLRVPVVEDQGSFSIRGGVLDLWPPGSARPSRAELFGDTVATLRAFDPDTQRTEDPVESVWLPPAREAVITPEVEERAAAMVRSLCDAANYPSTKARRLVEQIAHGSAFFGADAYLPAYYGLVPVLRYVGPDTLVLVEDPPSVLAALRTELERALTGAGMKADQPHFGVPDLYQELEELDRDLRERTVLALHRFAVASRDPGGPLGQLEAVPLEVPTLAMTDQTELTRRVHLARTDGGKHSALEPVLEAITGWQEAGLRVVGTARTVTQAERLLALLEHRQVRAVLVDDPLEPGSPDTVLVSVGPLARGVVAPTERLAVLTEEEIFGRRAHRAAARRRSPRAMLEDLRALQPGDHVVHVEHGIGRYEGLERKVINGVSVELLVIRYADADKLFVPVHRLDAVQKYAGGDSHPKLDRLGSQSFAKTKAKIRRRVRQMADELLRLYAERATLRKVPLPPPDDDYAAFEAAFPFEETPDQATAIAEVMGDLEREGLMDRLVCGDVGFGKTEVALRAALRTALAGRQVALLCPTTVLAQQHILTFTERLRPFALEVRGMSRFQSKREHEDTLRRLKEGSVDIVIGTHRLLSKDVHFKKLGLLVVDEEQRFGVTHKERIKQLRTDVDVLTLSATPIPRTLQMAIGGLRELSLISTPPVDRRAIRTIACSYDDEVIRDAVRRELGRGGQVYYVYNRIEGLAERAARLGTLVPEARVTVAHGQMPESHLERHMLDFMQGNYDVLVSTAIVENGLDISRANTIIVDRADLFGLSQLYQLRGRVGRASERAYCYLFLPMASQMTHDAQSRVAALERYTELGSGFHVAALDMELRGAGDVLGAEQSGFVASVGFDLFCRMLEDAKHELRGETLVQEVDPELSLDVEALLPEEYIEEVGVRLSLYKRLAAAADENEVTEIATEMEDRFGAPPGVTRNLIELMRLKTELRRLRALGCEATGRTATLHLRGDTPIDAAKLGALVAAGDREKRYRLTPDGRLIRRAGAGERFRDGLEHAARLVEELGELEGAG
jgi:transcription-repair coupling factor (superfamily II helicase)